MADETQAGMSEQEAAELKAFEDLARAAEATTVASDNVKAAPLPPILSNSRTIDAILDVMLQVTVEVGRARMTIQDLLQLGQGSVVELEKLAGEPLDVYINGRLVARGEAVIINEKFGVRLTEIISKEARVAGLTGGK